MWWEKDHGIKEVIRRKEKWLSIPPVKIKCESKYLSWIKYSQKDYFLVVNKLEPWGDSKTTAVVHERKVDYEYFNLMNKFLVSLVISFTGPWLKLLRVSWYKCMTPFWYQIHLVIKIHLYPFHNSFRRIENISNEEP